MNKLSAYTIATNCTDITDLQSGIDEINETIQFCMKEKRKIPSYYFVRLKKLETKLKRKQTINAKQKLSFTISITVSPVGLEMAIRHCLACHIPLTKRNIIKAIKNTVIYQANRILDSPEEWGERLNSINQGEIRKALEEIRLEFDL